MIGGQISNAGSLAGMQALGQMQRQNEASYNPTREQQGIPPSPPRTLASGLSSLEELNKRLSSAATAAYNLASIIGGPFPTSAGEKACADAQPQSAMERLNESVMTAHHLLSEIDNAISAMGRSLGANS